MGSIRPLYLPPFQRLSPFAGQALSDAEWDLIKPLIYPADARRGRGRQRNPDSARACLDTIRYVRKTGCQWSMIPSNLAPRSTAHDALSTWTGARFVAQPQRSPAHQDAFDAKKRPVRRR
ncbi:MAG: transposase [Verrucomicrobiaceae bacterium]|nr:transposase [Verrucomicrobiaceae bacterium]